MTIAGMDQIARQLAVVTRPSSMGPILTRRQGTIAAVNTGPPPGVDVTVGGIIIPGVRYLASYRPVVADVVWVDFNGADPLVIGSTAPAAQPVWTPQAGLTFQSGSTVQTTDGAGKVTVTYPVAFATTPQCVVLTNGERGQGLFFLSLTVRNANNFTFQVDDKNGAAITGLLVRVNWMASV